MTENRPLGETDDGWNVTISDQGVVVLRGAGKPTVSLQDPESMTQLGELLISSAVKSQRIAKVYWEYQNAFEEIAGGAAPK